MFVYLSKRAKTQHAFHRLECLRCSEIEPITQPLTTLAHQSAEIWLTLLLKCEILSCRGFWEPPPIHHRRWEVLLSDWTRRRAGNSLHRATSRWVVSTIELGLQDIRRKFAKPVASQSHPNPHGKFSTAIANFFSFANFSPPGRILLSTICTRSAASNDPTTASCQQNHRNKTFTTFIYCFRFFFSRVNFRKHRNFANDMKKSF